MRRAIPLFLLGVVVSACGATPTSGPGGPGGPGAPTVHHSYSATVLADGPVAYWRMGEASGTTMVDATRNANNGTYTAVTLGQPGALAGDKGTAGGFDGHTGWATVNSSPSLQVNWVTIELWINKTSDAGYGVYIAKNFASRGSVGSGWFQLVNNSFSGKLEFRVTGDVDPALVSSTVLSLNTWYYVAATFDGSVAKLYINGKLDASLPVVASATQTDDPIYIGRRADGFFTSAVLEEVAIYPTALSADRIAAHYAAATATS